MIFNKKNFIGLLVLAIVIVAFWMFFVSLGSVSNASAANRVTFQIKPGDGFRTVANSLEGASLIHSALSFEIFALLDGRASQLKPGTYQLSTAMNTPAILAAISGESAGVATVTIPEGSNMYEIDKILSDAMVLAPGQLAAFASSSNLQGKLFPDTYQFHTDANVAEVVQKMTDAFAAKAAPLFAADLPNQKRDLIIASLLEKEVPDQGDREIVAGIILKRLAAGMTLNIDATVCYAKLLARPATVTGPSGCYPLTALDFKIDSPYNTYLYKGLPPAPIGNPGTSAITAATHPQVSPYFYYLSDPKTGKTIFAKTLDEQNQNKVKYLEGNT